MTPEEFKKAAMKSGISMPAIEKQLAVHEKFISMGMTPTPLEAVLSAYQNGSCMDAFEAALEN